MKRYLVGLLAAAWWLSACGVDMEGQPADGLGSLDGQDEQGVFLGDPANNAVYGVDVSFWEGPIAQSEMDCLWNAGVRHVVAGTQVKEITVQQLEMAVARGMTVDAYVYLYWNEDIATQVREAFEFSSGFPMGRMWLDVEEAAGGLGANALAEKVQQAVDTCRALGGQDVECGIYTGPGYWRSAMGNTTRFADVPLWYAWYNFKTSLNSWSTEKFGGWSFPAAKQWAEQVECGVGLDKNTMQVVSTPGLTVDRSTPPRPVAVPQAPGGQYPKPGSTVNVGYVKMMVDSIAYATSWQFAVEVWDAANRRWSAYYTWSPSVPFIKVNPVWNNRHYRFRVRAKNTFGYGAWSPWSAFAYGAPAGTPPPVDSNTPPPPAPPPPPPATDGVPTGLTPDGTAVTASSVTLACGAVSSATRYEFAVEHLSGGLWRTYTSYTSATPHKTFWPQTRGTSYRFKVRAQRGGVYGDWSTLATFEVR